MNIDCIKPVNGHKSKRLEPAAQPEAQNEPAIGSLEQVDQTINKHHHLVKLWKIQYMVFKMKNIQ